MVGRGVISDPFYWRKVDQIFFSSQQRIPSRREVLERYASYASRMENRQGPRSRTFLIKPVLGLFTGCYNGRKFRRTVDELMRDKNRSIASVMLDAMSSSLDENVLEEV